MESTHIHLPEEEWYKEKIKKLAEHEKEKIMSQVHLEEEEKKKLLEKIRKKEEEQQKAKSKHLKMVKKMKKMEEKLVHGKQAEIMAAEQKKAIRK